MRGIGYFLMLLLAAIAAWAFSYFYKIDKSASVFFIALLWLVPLSVGFAARLLNREIEELHNEIRKKENRRSKFSGKLKGLRQERIYLEKKLMDLSNLYTITKEMSFGVKFSDMFGVFKNFVEDNFRFGKFRIAVFGHTEKKSLIDKIYEIKNGLAAFGKADEGLSNLADFIAKSKKPIFLREGPELGKFGFNSALKNVFAIPLILRGNVIAAVLVEDADPKDRDNYLVLAPQIALQIERIGLFDEIERLSVMDGLTGTFLRRFFLERLQEEISRARESKMNLSFAITDMDYFKNCNDNLGHLVGDVILKEVARIIKANVREIDFVSRYGGEEFAILLPETGKEGALIVGERIRKAVEEEIIKAYDESVRITISMGISSFPEHANTIDELIDEADKALYRAKKEGRNRVSVAA